MSQALFSSNRVPAQIVGLAPLPWLPMDTNVALRLQAWRLVRVGMNQKVIAGRMGMDPSGFSRWLRGDVQRPVSVTALDGLRRFLSELREEATVDVTSLSKDEQERLKSELESVKTERKIRRSVKSQARSKVSGKGKRLATKR